MPKFLFSKQEGYLFALEILGSKKAAVKFFQRESDSRYSLTCHNNQISNYQDFYEDSIGFSFIEAPCFYMRNNSNLDHSLKTFNNKVSLIKNYGKEEVILISSGEIVKLPFKKSNPGWLNII